MPVQPGRNCTRRLGSAQPEGALYPRTDTAGPIAPVIDQSCRKSCWIPTRMTAAAITARWMDQFWPVTKPLCRIVCSVITECYVRLQPWSPCEAKGCTPLPGSGIAGVPAGPPGVGTPSSAALPRRYELPYCRNCLTANRAVFLPARQGSPYSLETACPPPLGTARADIIG